MGDAVNEPTVLFWPNAGGTNHLVKTAGVGFGSPGPDGGQYASFGSSDYISVPVAGSASFTVAITLKPVTILFRVLPLVGGRLFCIRENAMGVFALSGSGPFDITVTPITAIRMATSGAPVLLNSWNTVAIVRNASNSWTCYVNGSAVTLATNSSTDDLMLRYYNHTTQTSCSPLFGNGFGGSLDDIRIYAAELSQSDINAEFAKVYR
jgi:hypothetical protein